MGACATKPKDLKGEAPEDAPENVPAAEVAASTKEAGEVISKDVVVVAEEEVKKEIEEGGGADDDDADRRRSLSNLFKENEEGKGSEQVKEEASQITQDSTPSEAKAEEAEKVVDAPVTSGIEKALKVASITAESPRVETSEEKKVEKVKSETKTLAEEKMEEVKLAVETPAEKKVEEVKPAVETLAEKKTEEAPAATHAPKPGAPLETEAEEKPAASKVTVIEENKSS
ncbi:hypothetical protein CQW23_28265 [Capsicum baccatum]|uniref:Uncharacterized protein n=1 Tax=Capsicum baccatum TaxID=33114 RepID=A0A2G2VG54_CAPBA|nr:hypothetical protein CQW23_28265 [Capsicum baccatum]